MHFARGAYWHALNSELYLSLLVGLSGLSTRLCFLFGVAASVLIHIHLETIWDRTAGLRGPLRCSTA